MTKKYLLGAALAAGLVLGGALLWGSWSAPRPATALRPVPSNADASPGSGPAPPAVSAALGSSTAVVQDSIQPVPATATASAPRGATPPLDLLVHQRTVQAALAADSPGLAGAAARAIQTCQLMLATEDKVHAALLARQHQQPDPRFNAAAERIAQGVRACQALDPQAAQHLEPLLRRSLAEGDVGSAARLRRVLNDRFEAARELALVMALRHDAWACDLPSAQALLLDHHRWPQLLSPTEQQVLRQVVDTRATRREQDALNSLIMMLPQEAQARLKASGQPSGPVDAAAAQALLGQVLAQCDAAGVGRR